MQFCNALSPRVTVMGFETMHVETLAINAQLTSFVQHPTHVKDDFQKHIQSLRGGSQNLQLKSAFGYCL